MLKILSGLGVVLCALFILTSQGNAHGMTNPGNIANDLRDHSNRADGFATLGNDGSFSDRYGRLIDAYALQRAREADRRAVGNANTASYHLKQAKARGEKMSKRQARALASKHRRALRTTCYSCHLLTMEQLDERYMQDGYDSLFDMSTQGAAERNFQRVNPSTGLGD